eukprot:scaffold912_cov119-Cylindrotheca_fusiformis.AAC.14
MWSSKVYMKSKIIRTPLATIHVESEVYETPPPPPKEEGPPRWLDKTKKRSPEEEKRAMQQQHLDHLYQLGQRHTKGSHSESKETSEAKESGSSDVGSDVGNLRDEKNSVSARQQVEQEKRVGLHRLSSNRRMGDSTKRNIVTPEVVKVEEKEEEQEQQEMSFALTLQNISNKLLFASPVDEEKECYGAEESKAADTVSMEVPKVENGEESTLLDVISKKLYQGFMFYTASNDEQDEEKEKTTAPSFANDQPKEKRRQQQKQQDNCETVPVKEIEIMNMSLQQNEGQGCRSRLHSDDMSCVTIPNMIRS